MSEHKIFERLKCASYKKEHFLVEPLKLVNCDHYICKKCIPFETAKLFKCRICSFVSQQDFKETEVLEISEENMLNINEIFYTLEEETNKKINELEEAYKKKDNDLGINVGYINEEIDIRAESLIIQIEEVRDEFKKELENIRKNVLDSKKWAKKIEKCRQDFYEFHQAAKNELNEDCLMSYQQKINELNKYMNEIDETKLPKIEVSLLSLERDPTSIIGNIVFPNEIDVRNFLKNGKTEYIYLDACIDHMASLPNDQIIATIVYNRHFDFRKNLTELRLYDQNFNLIKKVDKINKNNLSIRGIAVNREKEVLYMTDGVSKRILVIDFELNYISASEHKFFDPFGTCFKNDFLYVCDYLLNRIKIFDQNLLFCTDKKFDYSPAYTITISNSKICLVMATRINFYNLNNSSHHSEIHSSLEGFIFEHNNWFYYFKDFEVNCYDENANLSEKIYLNENPIQTQLNSYAVIANKSLLIGSAGCNRITKIILN